MGGISRTELCNNPNKICLPEVYPMTEPPLSAQPLVKSLLTNYLLAGRCGVVEQRLIEITPCWTFIPH